MSSRIVQSLPSPDIDKSLRIIQSNKAPYLLVLPTILFLLTLIWLPFFHGVWMSFHQWPLTGTKEWTGLSNYTRLFTWDVFYTSIKATTVFATSTIIQLIVALVAALVVNKLDRLQNIVSGSLLISYTMPPVVTGTIWVFLLNPDFGPIFQFLRDVSLLENAIYWSANGTPALIVITLVNSWTFWPFMFIIILASLDSIPNDQYECAKVYGANRLQTLLWVTLPQLKSAILVAISIRMIWNLTKVSQPLQMTGGGPSYETSILAILLYRFAGEGQMGLAFAIGVVLLAITLVFSAVFIWMFEKEADRR